MFTDSRGIFRQVNSKDQVPEEFREKAKCFSNSQKQLSSTPKPAPQTLDQLDAIKKERDSKAKELRAKDSGDLNQGYLAKPEEIDLKGTVRHEDLASSIGRIDLRWPRKVELLFGRTPSRAMSEAASAVSRALKKGGFPPNVQSLDLDWNVVFMDEDVPEKQIPQYLVNNCHPAWMTPIANLYVVAQRVVAGCNGGGSGKYEGNVADAMLTQILIHEMGHAVEFQLLQGVSSDDRMRAEGFACWFEQYASDFSSVIPSGEPSRFYRGLAKRSIQESPDKFYFQGSAQDYARGSMYMRSVVERRGISGLMQVYKTMREQKIDFFKAAKIAIDWDTDRFNKEILKSLGYAAR